MSNLLAQGGFGCVYYPAIPKRPGRPRTDAGKFVTKIQRDDSSARNEIRIGDKIRGYSNYALFFLPVVRSWKLKVSGKKLAKFQDCDAIDATTKDYVAQDIAFVDAISYDQVLIQAPPRHRLLLLMEGYRYLLRALVVLQELKICHFDLKHSNVLYLRSNKLPLIADFGISISDPQSIITRSIDDTIFKLKKYFYIYTTQYRLWCIDIIVLSWIADQRSWCEADAAAIFDDFMNNAVRWDFIRKDKADAWYKSTHKQLMLYGSWEVQKVIDYLLDQWTTWDSYSLGVMYGETIASVGGNEHSAFLQKWGNIIRTSISPNPEERIPVQQAVKAFEDLFLTEDDPRAYEKLVHDFTIASSMRKDPHPIPGGRHFEPPKIEAEQLLHL